MACEPVQGVFLHCAIASAVTPALGKHFIVHYNKLDDVFESFEKSHNGCAICPRATPVDVENLSICQICARQVIPYALCYEAGNVFIHSTDIMTYVGNVHSGLSRVENELLLLWIWNHEISKVVFESDHLCRQTP